MAEQVIHHVAMGRTLYYHALGEHLYWQTGTHAELPPPAGALDQAVFTRAHNGWAEGMCLWDRFIKNTHQVLSPLNRLTSQSLIERYDFLDDRRLVRKTTFDNGTTATVNGSSTAYETASVLGGTVRLPPYGFLVEAETFVAFHALSWNGQTYTQPVLFTLTSLDGKPLDQSEQMQVYHGFGASELNWRNRTVNVQREAIL